MTMMMMRMVMGSRLADAQQTSVSNLKKRGKKE